MMEDQMMEDQVIYGVTVYEVEPGDPLDVFEERPSVTHRAYTTREAALSFAKKVANSRFRYVPEDEIERHEVHPVTSLELGFVNGPEDPEASEVQGYHAHMVISDGDESAALVMVYPMRLVVGEGEGG